MGDPFGVLLNNVERFLRWVYPGLLVLGLLQLGTTDGVAAVLKLKNESDAVQIFGLVVATIVVGFIVYAMQSYLLNEGLVRFLLFFCLFPLGDAYNYAKSRNAAVKDTRWWQLWRRHPAVFWHWSIKLNLESQELWGGRYRQGRAYDWGVTHALGLTSWLILLAAVFAQKRSTLDDLNTGVIVVGALLGLAWLWQELKNVLPGIWGQTTHLEELRRSFYDP